MEFDLPGGIPESWPKLLEALNLDDHEDKQSAAAQVEVLISCFALYGIILCMCNVHAFAILQKEDNTLFSPNILIIK